MQRRRLRSSNEGWLTSYADLITNLLIFFALIVSASQLKTGKMERIAQAMSQTGSEETLASAEKKIKASIAEQKLTENVSVKLTDDGLELSFDSGVIFASGSAEILPDMNEPLTKVLEVLKPYATKYLLAIEGHTDEVPITSGRFKSNWELSSGRAMQLRERLESTGIDRHRLKVEAYSDTKTLDPKATEGLSRDQFLAKHRRVVVRLY
jgi:chemotaxis protein MotB